MQVLPSRAEAPRRGAADLRGDPLRPRPGLPGLGPQAQAVCLVEAHDGRQPRATPEAQLRQLGQPVGRKPRDSAAGAAGASPRLRRRRLDDNVVLGRAEEAHEEGEVNGGSRLGSEARGLRKGKNVRETNRRPGMASAWCAPAGRRPPPALTGMVPPWATCRVQHRCTAAAAARMPLGASHQAAACNGSQRGSRDCRRTPPGRRPSAVESGRWECMAVHTELHGPLAAVGPLSA
mmetsp:Transcript_106366/g.338725  ORF Transcript_106366/g.338725 Transcript_106366/m.338725 type:complete len:234 (-) Transcript_106366:7-708(-)